jgi:branched-chain amino acid transport system substrate-binding protein
VEARSEEPPAPAPATPGVTADEIKIGQSVPYSGPVSALSVIGRVEAAYFKMINDSGGVNGRKITLISRDDGYSPPKAVENIRGLVEGDGVAMIFSSTGTAANIAVRKYLNERQVPQLFVASGADRWAEPDAYPWTIGWQPSYRLEARIYGKYILANKPRAKICVLYQNDDFGKDYLRGLQEGLTEENFEKLVMKLVSYEVTDRDVESQILALQASGCTTLVSATTPKFGAQTIRKVYDIGWKPTLFMSAASVSLTAVLRPVGLNKAVGIITGVYLKDPGDPAYRKDRGVADWRAFMAKYLPDADTTDINYVIGYGAAQTLVQVITQCGNDLSRTNIMTQAASLKHFQVSVAIPGVDVNTSATDYRPITKLQLARFDGTRFQRFGNLIDAE